MANALAPVMASDEFEVIQRTARMLAVSGYFDAKGESPVALAQVATKIIAGRELGFGPFAAVNGIYIIQGRPAVGANLMAAAVKGGGRYDYRVREMTPAACRIEFFQRVGDRLESLGMSEFTAEDARKAQTKNMDKFPKNMLFARAMSNGVRWFCPDVFSGNAVYVPEELGADVDGEGNVIEVQGRVVNVDTGEIHRNGNDDAPPPADNPFDGDAPWYTRAWESTPNDTRALLSKMRALHMEDNRPCSPAQYQYLSGLLNSIVGKGDQGHSIVLSIICQTEVTGDNRPSFELAQKLLDYLPTHTKIEGKKVENPNYRADIVEHIKRVASALQPEPA